MAIFGGLVLTNTGRNLEAKAQLGKTLKFKRIALGDGEMTTESMLTMNELIHEVLSLDILDKKLLQDDVVKIVFYLTNQSLETGFTWRELGIIAEDPDTKEEVLYCYGNARENGEYIDSKNGQDVVEKYVSVDLIVSNVENVVVSIDESKVYATSQEVGKMFTMINNTKADKKKTWNISIGTSWVGDVAPYTQSIDVEGLMETDVVNIYPIWSEDVETRITEREEYNKISVVKSIDGGIELICNEEKTNVLLNVRMEVLY